MEGNSTVRAIPGSDELGDLLARRGQLTPAGWDDLVDRLAVYGVTYLAGGSADAGKTSVLRGPGDVSLPRLIRDLVEAPEPRLRDALIALLLRHPELAPEVATFRATLGPDDPARTWLAGRVLAASALQQIWRDTLSRYGLAKVQIDVADLLTEYSTPGPEIEGGRALLHAAGHLLAGGRPIDIVGGWEDVTRHVIRGLEWSTQPAGAG